MAGFSLNPEQVAARSVVSLAFAERVHPAAVPTMLRSCACCGGRALAMLAANALIDEADLTPKPALVDRRGPGAHNDLSLERMHKSVLALYPCFVAIAEVSAGQKPCQELRERLAEIGRAGERAMFRATDGSNAHKGAIWTLGLLVSAAAICGEKAGVLSIASVAGALARYPDSRKPLQPANGEFVRQRYGVAGAQGEACNGFPHVVAVGLPALLAARRRGVPERFARLDALMAIMAELDDTCLLHRGGMTALDAANRGARAVLREGGTSTPQGMEALVALDAGLLSLHASPGGSADLLAATLFLDSVTRQIQALNMPIGNYGDAELWKS